VCSIQKGGASVVVFTLLLLSAMYGIVILGSVLLLRKMGVSGKRAIILSFLVFGAVTGVLTAWVWPIDSSIYFNFFASLLGDQIYNLSIQYVGDSSSPQAHYTIPWVLRIPQVYVIASIILCGLVSLPLQWVYNRGLKVNKENT
ncbi:MAG: hypothetical protein ACETWR_18155, partial [Anaerolineae bacterium]